MHRRDFFRAAAAFLATAAAVRKAEALPQSPSASFAKATLTARMNREAAEVMEAIREHRYEPIGLTKSIRGRKFSVMFVAGKPKNRMALWEVEQMIDRLGMVEDGRAEMKWIEVFNAGAGCRIDYEVVA